MIVLKFKLDFTHRFEIVLVKPVAGRKHAVKISHLTHYLNTAIFVNISVSSDSWNTYPPL